MANETLQKPESTSERGNRFRDLVMSHLSAAGFSCTSEVRAGFKKADGRAVWTRNDVDGLATYLIEAKDYGSTLPLSECTSFVTEYRSLIERGLADKAWLISKGPISPDGRLLIENTPLLKCFSLEEFQRTLLQVDGYLRDLISLYDEREIARFYVPPHTEEGEDLKTIVRAWVEDIHSQPLAVISGYGKGKTTFAIHLAATMAEAALVDKTERIPVLIQLGEVMDVVGIDSLLGKVFSSRHRAINYHFHLFDELNRAGRFLIILDGFDEMKHGMTLSAFERAFAELMRFDQGDARLLILGRNTAFHNDDEFRAVILGKQKTTLGREVSAPDRHECRPVTLREFTPEEVRRYVSSYFPLRLKQRNKELARNSEWVTTRTEELLSDQFTELIVRPVHAQMLCEVATDPSVSLANMTKLTLYDTFVHYLLDREVKKAGRDPAFPVQVRRRFNASVAWWLWERGGLSTASLDSIPAAIATESAGALEHDYDIVGLQRELAAGLLVEKTGQTIYFAHRSIQEFLVAEHLLTRGLLGDRNDRNDPSTVLKALNPEIIDFLVACFMDGKLRDQALEWVYSIEGIRSKIRPGDLTLPMRLAAQLELDARTYVESPWLYWLGFFVWNGKATFEVSERRFDKFVDYLALGWRRLPSPEAALTLMVGAFSASHDNLNWPTSALIAAWLPVDELASAVEEALKGKSSIAQVRREDQFALWSFLHLVNVINIADGLSLIINYVKMREMVNRVPIGFLEDKEPQEQPGHRFCSVQGLYRELVARKSSDEAKRAMERQLENIRPFFNDPDVRARIRPLVVERRIPGKLGAAR